MLHGVTHDEKQAWLKANPDSDLAACVLHLPWRKTFLDSNCQLTIDTLAWLHITNQRPYEWVPLDKSALSSRFVRITLYNAQCEDPTESVSAYEHVMALVDDKYLVQSYFGKHAWHCAELTAAQRAILSQDKINGEQYLALCPPGVTLQNMDEMFVLQQWTCHIL